VRKRLERAIERGLIAWHALPFTTHTELMSPALFRAGLSYAQELDRRFDKTSIAAKMTDVPGHTLGMVPLLAEAGVKFLHLGVNTASPVPDVPPIFRWRAPGRFRGLVVMYQASYGETDFPAGDDIGLSFAHTNDNIGPQSVGQTVEALRGLRHARPGRRHRRLHAGRLWRRDVARAAKASPSSPRRSATAGFSAPPPIRKSSPASAPCNASTTPLRRPISPRAGIAFGRVT
jgi:hypothetical protein